MILCHTILCFQVVLLYHSQHLSQLATSQTPSHFQLWHLQMYWVSPLFSSFSKSESMCFNLSSIWSIGFPKFLSTPILILNQKHGKVNPHTCFLYTNAPVRFLLGRLQWLSVLTSPYPIIHSSLPSSTSCVKLIAVVYHAPSLSISSSLLFSLLEREQSLLRC